MDLTSWSGVLTTVIGIALFALIGVSIRLMLMMSFQQRRERANRQISERLKTLMAAYKVLGGSFTGALSVDPRHMRDLRRAEAEGAEGGADEGSDRARRIRDAVEAALSDIILLGTDEQVRLAQRAATALVEGRPVHTDELVVSLRDFIRASLDLAPIPPNWPSPVRAPPARAARREAAGVTRAVAGAAAVVAWAVEAAAAAWAAARTAGTER
ncbi:hypothetical protein, partial [Brevundimonas sp.]|uniref:hypothetical protein n=1 Tax=Brevundimonas sp. TaxID=1871086 RepID=UPI0025B8BF84